MAGLKFVPDDAASLPDKPLGDANVGVKLTGGAGSYEGAQKLKDIKFAFGVEPSHQIREFPSVT